MSVEYRQSALPPIGSMDSIPLKLEEVDYTSRRPTLPALSTAASSKYSHPVNYSAQPSSQKPSTNGSAVPSVAFMTSSASSRKQPVGEHSAPTTAPHPPRHSLPSIQEALGGEPVHGPTSTTSTHSPYPNTSPASPNFTWKTTHPDPYQTSYARPDPQSSSRVPYTGYISPATPAPRRAYPRNAYTPRAESVDQQPYMNGTHSPRQNNQPLPSQSWPPPIPNQYDQYAQAAEPPRQQYSYGQSQSHAVYPPHPPPTAHAPTNPPYPNHATYVTPQEHPSAWQNDEADFSSSESAKRHRGSYGESVKRHLDVFDLESSLENIANSSKRVLDFSHHYSTRAHQTQRSGPLPGSTPNLVEIDDMVKHGQDIQESLARLREVVASQQAALAARSKDQYLHKAAKHPSSDDGSVYQDGTRDGGNGADSNKKRRGRAAPPGRCHSCNRAETPEWRRGPDGARTLCNACGLHYAKLTRKMGASKVPIGNSNLGLKQVSPGSPSM